MKKFRSIYDWYLNLPIRRKLLLWFVPMLIVMIASTGYYAYSTAADEIVTKMSLEQAGIAKQAVDHLDYIAQDALNISDYLFLTPEIQALLGNTDNETYVEKENVVDPINRLMVTRPYFQFLTIYSPHFPTIQFNNKGLSSAIPFEEYRTKFHYDEILANPKIENWSVEVPDRSNSIFHGDSMKKLLLTKVLKNDTNMKPEGILILGIDEKDIRTSYSPGLGQAGLFVINSDGTILSDSTGHWIGHAVSELPYFSRPVLSPDQIHASSISPKWIFSHIQSSVTGWHVLVIQPRDALVNQLNRIKWSTSFIAGLALILSLFVSWSIAVVITRPIKRILTSMKKLQIGDFTQQVSVVSRDELGQLGSGYNIMVQRIKELVQDVYAFEIRQYQAELKVLQSQINPHFLYNTLNTIAWSAEKNNDRHVAEMIYSLSSIFKISLSEGRDIISLEKELQLAEHYLFLQKMRYPDKLSYEIDIAPELLEFHMPKLLVQPLVENAVVHGIEPLSGDAGHIHIAVSQSEDAAFVEIEVTDNGVGISEELLRLLNGKLEWNDMGAHPGEHFALINIKNRLRLFYGETADLNIQSLADSGTRVRMTLPYPATR